MLDHRTRVLVITVMLAVSVLGLVIMSSLGVTEGTAFGALIGLASTLAHAFFDALNVQRRGTLRTVHQLEDDNAQLGPSALTDAEQELLEERH